MKTLNIKGEKVKVNAFMQISVLLSSTLDRKSLNGKQSYYTFLVLNGVEKRLISGILETSYFNGKRSQKYVINGKSVGDSEKKALEMLIETNNVTL